jgi:hypothetical protein
LKQISARRKQVKPGSGISPVNPGKISVSRGRRIGRYGDDPASQDPASQDPAKGASMRGIAFVLASAMVVAGFAVAIADQSVAPAPIRLAVFPFELEDFSAAAAYVPPDDVDREQLRLSTEEVRRLIAESGRYQLVDVGTVNDEAAKAGKLHYCGGCEAKIAAGLHADQSMIGIVTRISRTDYAVTYKIRDAQSGALVDVQQTDLRAGANSAWSRGARWLIQRRLLEKAN